MCGLYLINTIFFYEAIEWGKFGEMHIEKNPKKYAFKKKFTEFVLTSNGYVDYSVTITKNKTLRACIAVLGKRLD